ncbi:MAG: TraB/GumN family protein [Bacillota bacterium]
MKWKKRSTALLMVLVMEFALQTSALAQENIQGGAGWVAAFGQSSAQTQEMEQAQEQEQEQAQEQGQPQNTADPAQVEQPSGWALEGVNWSAIYGLADQSMFSSYKSAATFAELFGIACNIYEKITSKSIEPAEDAPFTESDGPEAKEAWTIGILTDEKSYEPRKTVNRGEVISVLFDTLESANVGLDLTAGAGSQAGPVEYFISAGLIKGRQDGQLALDEPCSRQEVLVLAWRVYEFVVYETGNDSKGLLWKASDDDSSVYLLGSIHFADPSIYPLSKKILEAYDKADYLVVEADIANQAEDIRYMQTKMMYTGDDTLDKNIPKDLYDKFVEVIKPLNIPPEIYNKLKPWYAAMLVQGTELLQGSISANIGIDMYFLSKAAGKKPIMEIEGIRFQVDMFDSLSNELQVWYLASALASATGGRQQAQDGRQTGSNQQAGDSRQQAVGEQSQAVIILLEILDSWKRGDPGIIEMLLELEASATDAQTREFNHIFWTTRNNNMFDKTMKYLSDPENKTYFIVVGAGHMGGESGIITQLKKSGITVEQVK